MSLQRKDLVTYFVLGSIMAIVGCSRQTVFRLNSLAHLGIELSNYSFDLWEIQFSFSREVILRNTIITKVFLFFLQV